MADAASKAELAILQRLSDLLSVGLNNEAIDYQTVQLANIQRFRRELLVELRRLNAEAAATIQATLEKAYGVGSASALADLSALATATSALRAPAVSESLRALATELTGKIEAVSNYVLRQAPDIYQQVVGRAVEQMALGGVSRQQAVQQVLSQLVGDGIMVAPANSNGARMNLTDYVKMATRTGATNAAIEGHSQALLQNGLNLCMIQLGPRPCETCDQWANKILAVDGTAPGLYTLTNLVTGKPMQVRVEGTLAEARAAGWGHPNCRCGIRAYIPGATPPPQGRLVWDKVGYEAQQRQREVERQIRSYKTEAAIALSPEARAAAASKVSQWQATQRDLMQQYPFLKRQYANEQI